MSLLSFLFGGGHPSQQQQPPVAQGPSGTQYPYDQNGNIVAVPPQGQAPVAPGSLVQHLATMAPAAPLAASAAPQPPQQPQDQAPIEVTGDSWHPRKASVLGQISDYILGTHFGKNTVRQNMEGALQHLNSDPQEAISRMTKFNPEGAMDLYSKVASEQHWNALAKREGDLTALGQTKAFMPIAAGMMNRISTGPDGQPLAQIDPAAWQAARNQLLNVGSHFGMTPEQINDLVPETPDVNVARALAAGEFPVSRQASTAEKRDEFGKLLPIRQQNANANTTRAGAAAQQANTGVINAQTSEGRLNEEITKDRTTEQQRQQGLDQKPPKMRVIMTKYGPMETSGNVGILRRPDGSSLRYISTDGVNFVPTHQKPKGK